MAEEGAKSFQLIKCLKKFDGKASAYPEWKYNTRRTIGLYKPNISRLLTGTWNPTPEYEEQYNDHESGDDSSSKRANDDDEQETSTDSLRKELEKAEKNAKEANEDHEEAKKTLAAKTKTGSRRVTKAQSEAIQLVDTTKQIADQANEIVKLWKAQLAAITSAKPPSATARSDEFVYSPHRRVAANQVELDEYQEADTQLFNILYLILTDAASFILRRLAPVDDSSGSGLKVWQALEDKYQPHDENRRRHLERELEAAKMRTGTDPDIFITHVWHLAEQINFIGGNITQEKCADIILQGLPEEYELIRYSASADTGYDLDKITQTARNLWYSRTRTDGATSTRGHRSSARDAGMTATTDHRSRQSQDVRNDSNYKRGPQCYQCKRFGHVQRNCHQARPRPQHQQRRQGPRSGTREPKWCSLHNTHLHSDSECRAQSAGRNAQAGGQGGRQDQHSSGSFNLQRNNGANTAQGSTGSRARGSATTATAVPTRAPTPIQPTEEAAVEGYCGDLGYPCIANNMEQQGYTANAAAVTDTNRISLLVDSGASGHYLDSNLITDLDNILDDYTVLEHPLKIVGVGGHELHGVGEGVITALALDVEGDERKVRFKCTTVPGLGRHLFSTGAATKKGAYTIISDRPRIELPSTTGTGPEIELGLRKEGTLYYLDVKIIEKQYPRGFMNNGINRESAYTFTRPESVNLWHRRLAHCHEGILKATADIKETGVVLKDEYTPCKTCKIQKSTQKKHPKSTKNTAVQPCQRVYTDLLGPITPTAKGGYNYVSKFTDEYSRMNVVYLIKTKNEAIDTLTRFVQDIVIPNGFRLERLRSDCGGEYTAEYFRKYCKQTGIVQEMTAPATPQQNGVSERAGRTLMNIVRCLLDGANLPENLWGELCCTAVYITNRLPHVHLGNQTPYFRMFGKHASLQHLRVIGSSAFVHIETHKSKLDQRAWEGKLVGYSHNSRAYRIYNPQTRKIVSSRNVTFIEPMDVAMPPAESDDNCDGHPTTSSPDLRDSGNDGENTEDDYLPEHDASDTEEDEPADSSSSEEEEEEDKNNNTNRMVLRSSRSTGLQYQQEIKNKRQLAELRRLSPWGQLANFVDNQRIKSPTLDEPVRPPATIPIPTTYQEAMRSVDATQWKAAMDKEMLSLKEHEVADLVPIEKLPPGAKPIGSRWLYKVKATGVMKARLIVQGWGQRHGIDCGSTYAPVSRFSSQLVLMAIAAERGYVVETMDVVTAFLQSQVEEDVYVRQAKGYEILDEDTGLPMVMKLKKSLYGLRQSPRNWGNAFAKGIAEIGFVATRSDPCMYVYGSGPTHTILCVYVDDCTLAGKTPSVVQDLKKQLSDKFRMTDGGPATLLLGMEISQRDGEITVSQHNYVLNILDKYNMKDCKPVATPGTGAEIEREPENAIYLNEMDTKFYQGVIGSLLFLTNTTRWEIGYAVMVLCRGMNKPTNMHLAGAKRVLRYLKGTPDLPIKFRRGQWQLHGFCDANFAGSSESLQKRSTTGYLFMLAGGVISASSSLQKLTAQSTVHAEIIAMATTAREALYLQGVISELGFPCGNIPIHSDSTGALSTAGNSSFRGRSKFIATRYWLLRQSVENGDIILKHVGGDVQLADCLTKHLPHAQFLKLRTMVQEYGNPSTT